MQLHAEIILKDLKSKRRKYATDHTHTFLTPLKASLLLIIKARLCGTIKAQARIKKLVQVSKVDQWAAPKDPKKKDRPVSNRFIQAVKDDLI